MIKHVFLDLDDTILDFHRAERVAISSTFSEVGCPADDATLNRYSEINRSCWQRLEAGEWTREEVLVGRFRILFDELSVDADPERTQAIYEDRLCNYHFFMDGAERLLDELYGRYKLYIASNGTARVQDSRIAASGIAKYFDGIFVSQRVGADKPSAAFFERVFSEIEGFDKNSAIIVGDSLTSDILGGRNAGILTCYFNPGGRKPASYIFPDYEIASLDQLLPLLQGINKLSPESINEV
ncbi:MAG: YjjG family noncanonical pyrimidine nucleotidase [Clostridia bacterium]|nr:YjjG family noncanonical pyrimidine nucleotidase [Clostridia bacterium]